MQKFEEIKLKVPNFDKIIEKINILEDSLKNASNEKEALKIVNNFHRLDDEVSSLVTIITIRYSLDTHDQKIAKANDACDENMPRVSAATNNFYKALVSSKYRNYLENKLGSYYFVMLENSLKSFDEKIIEDLIEENRLSSNYDKIMASAQIEFEGEIYNLSQMGKFSKSLDRETRKKASIAVDNWLSEHEEEIGTIYDKLVHLRDNMAHKLGYDNFVKLGYLRLGRSDYDAEMVKNYRKQISDSVVQICQKLYKIQAKRLGMNFNKMATYDFNLSFKDGNPMPKGSFEELINCAKTMYEDMSKESGEFINFMLDNHLMDLKARNYKAPGGYMTYIPKYKAPFIFANFNGTQDDVNVLTHEAGHAFQGYLSRNIKIPIYRMPTLEACEIHSMSMEFFAWPYMDLFFKEDSKKYKISHLEDAFKFLPYGITIDEFQHWVYENPNATHAQRCEKFKEIESRYTPHKHYIDLPCSGHGAYWIRQSHVFGSPFYYIDYTLAQVLALSFLNMMDKDRQKAFNKYIKLCKCGGKYPFVGLLEKNHLINPFIDGNVKKIVQKSYKILKKLESE